MKKFRYLARDDAGEEYQGNVEAESREEAIDAIRRHGLVPTAIGEVRESQREPSAPEPDDQTATRRLAVNRNAAPAVDGIRPAAQSRSAASKKVVVLKRPAAPGSPAGVPPASGGVGKRKTARTPFLFVVCLLYFFLIFVCDMIVCGRVVVKIANGTMVPILPLVVGGLGVLLAGFLFLAVGCAARSVAWFHFDLCAIWRSRREGPPPRQTSIMACICRVCGMAVYAYGFHLVLQAEGNRELTLTGIAVASLLLVFWGLADVLKLSLSAQAMALELKKDE